MANSNIQLLSLSSKKKKMFKNWVIDFQKSWVEKYMVKNVIREDVISLYTDLLQRPACLTAGKQRTVHANLDHAEWRRFACALQMSHFQCSH
jgi:hypothetical protein